MPYLCFPFTKQGWPSSMLSRWCCFWIQRDGHPPMRTTIWGLNYVQLTRGGMTRGPFIPCFDPGMCQYCIITQCLPDLVIFRDFSICVYIYIYTYCEDLRRVSDDWNSHLANMFLGRLSLGSFLFFLTLPEIVVKSEEHVYKWPGTPIYELLFQCLSQFLVPMPFTVRTTSKPK